MQSAVITLWLGVICCLPLNTHAGLIGRALASGPDLGLLQADNPFRDTFSSRDDGFQLYRRDAGTAIPAALLDDGTGDALGLITGSDTQPFFGVVDTINAENALAAVARWVFAIDGYRSLQLALGLAAMGDFERSDSFRWQYRVDGGPPVTLFEARPNERASQTYALTGGEVILADPMQVAGVLLDNRFNTFSATLPERGNQLTIELSAMFNGGAEVGAFRNLLIRGETQISAPGTLSVMLIAVLGLLTARRAPKGSAEQLAN